MSESDAYVPAPTPDDFFIQCRGILGRLGVPAPVGDARTALVRETCDMWTNLSPEHKEAVVKTYLRTPRARDEIKGVPEVYELFRQYMALSWRMVPMDMRDTLVHSCMVSAEFCRQAQETGMIDFVAAHYAFLYL